MIYAGDISDMGSDPADPRYVGSSGWKEWYQRWSVWEHVVSSLLVRVPWECSVDAQSSKLARRVSPEYQRGEFLNYITYILLPPPAKCPFSYLDLYFKKHFEY